MASYGDIILKSLKFSIHPKRWLPFFVLDAAFFSMLLAMLFINFDEITNLLMTLSTSPMAFASLAGYALVIIAGAVVWYLLRIWISGAVIHQSVKPREFGKSWTVSRKRFLSLLAVTIIVGLIYLIASMVPFMGWALSIIVSLIFFFVLPAIIVDRKPFDVSMTDSYRIFRKRPLGVFLAWLLITIISFIITALFMVPAMVAVFGNISPYMGNANSSTMGIMALVSLLNNIWVLAATGLVAVMGIDISLTFNLKAQTDFYGFMKKKRLGIF